MSGHSRQAARASYGAPFLFQMAVERVLPRSCLAGAEGWVFASCLSALHLQSG